MRTSGSALFQMKTSKYVVWFHYNKPYSRQTGEDYWSVHFRDTCYFVKSIKCGIPTFSKNNKRQPRVVMKGYARSVVIDDECAVIE